MKTNKKQPIHTVILNLIQDLQRLLLSLINDIRGRFQDPVLRHYGAGPTVMPRFGMTPLFNNGAFTLIELLVVVLIIGILAAVAVPQYKLAVTKARVQSMIPIINSIAKAGNIYYLANGNYTSNVNLLDISMPGECQNLTGTAGGGGYIGQVWKCGPDFLIDNSGGQFPMLFFCPGQSDTYNSCLSQMILRINTYTANSGFSYACTGDTKICNSLKL